jgi:alpha-glucosidase
MASDFIENYENNGAFQFIKDVPIDWDTTVVINGEIGEFVTIARRDRNSKDWYIGSITNETERNFEFDLKFLDRGTYHSTIYADKNNSDWKSNPLEYQIIKKELSNKDKLSIRLASGGGQAIRLKYIIQ